MHFAQDGESNAFYYKIIADYYRYVAESNPEKNFEEVKRGALQSYDKALEYTSDLNPCNSIKLGIILNYSVFQLEVMKDSLKAIEMAEKGLQEAVDNIDDVD